MSKEGDKATEAPTHGSSGGRRRRRKKPSRSSSTERETIAKLEARVAELEAEVSEAADRALRTLAEFDNFRRRSHREREDAASRGMADVLRELLDVADNFDRALEHAGNDVPEAFLEGMNLVARGLHDLLDRKGVSRMEADGKPFDPEYHEALTRQPVAGAVANTIVRVVQPGYVLNDRVLRPAKVIVAAPVPSPVDAPARGDSGEGP